MKVVAKFLMPEGKFLKNTKNKLWFTSNFFNISFDHNFVSQKSNRHNDRCFNPQEETGMSFCSQCFQNIILQMSLPGEEIYVIFR